MFKFSLTFIDKIRGQSLDQLSQQVGSFSISTLLIVLVLGLVWQSKLLSSFSAHTKIGNVIHLFTN